VEITIAIKAYVEVCQQKNYSPKSIKEIARLLKQYARFLAENKVKTVKKINQKINDAYRSERYYAVNQYGRQNSVAYRNRELIEVRNLLSYLFKKGHHPKNLTELIVCYRVQSQRLPKNIMTKREVKKLFKLPDLDNPFGYRDRMMMEILYATGMRRSELNHLNIADINPVEKTVFIREGKGQKDRVVPINYAALGFVSVYVNDTRPRLLRCYHADVKEQGPQHLLVGQNTLRLDDSSLNNILKPYLKKLTTDKRLGIHSFRHTFATHMVQQGMPVRYLQEILGHDDLNTTMRYLQLNIKDLQKEYRKCHPLARN
jgi:integrase/recombinase XerD